MKKIVNVIKKVFLAIWSFILSLFSKSKVKKTNNVKVKNESLDSEKKQVKIKIVDNLGNTEEPQSRDIEANIITLKEVKDIIRNEYQEITSKNNNESSLLEDKILEQVKMQVKNAEITTIKELKSEIKEQVKDNVKKTRVNKEIVEQSQNKQEEKNISENKDYVKKTSLKDYFVLEFLDGTYALADSNFNILTARFKYKIADYQDKYLKAFYNDLYYVYDFKGNLLTKNGFLDIRLFEEFYAVINNDYMLDVREYLDPNFKLSSPILLDKMRYQTDYDIKKYISEYRIKIKSRNKTYRADTKGVILDSIIVDDKTVENNTPTEKHTSDINLDLDNNSNTNQNIDNKNIESDVFIESPKVKLKNEEVKELDIQNNANELKPKTIQEETSNPNINNQKTDKSDEKTVTNTNESNPEINTFTNETLNILDTLTSNTKLEINKEEIEDKNYEALENELNALLEKIENKKRNAKNPKDLQNLNNLEAKANYLKNNIENQKNTDIIKEKGNLENAIHTSELYDLQTEIKNVHLNNKQDLNNYAIENIEDLNMIDSLEANKIEKELLKKELKKAGKIAKVSNVLSALPFLRNKYFRLFASGMLVKTHLKIYENILKRKNIEYRNSNFNNMVNGHTALNGALSLTVRNVNRLDALVEATKHKFPEMNYDLEYNESVSNLKNSLLTEQEKMLKKKSVINKYNLFSVARVRELKRV